MNNISKKLLAYSLLGIALTGCNNKPQDKEKDKFHQTFKEVLTNNDIDQKVLEKISEFFNNTENSYETFIQIVNMSEDKLSIMHEKFDDQKIKKFIYFVTMIKLTALFSEVSTINQEIQKDTEEEIVDDKIEKSSNQSSLNDDYDEAEENINTETTVNEEVKEVVTIEENKDEITTENEKSEIKARVNEENELLTDSNDYDVNENDYDVNENDYDVNENDYDVNENDYDVNDDKEF